MSLLVVAVPIAVWIVCAGHDAARFKIPNRYVGILAGAWLPCVLLAGGGLGDVLSGLAAGALFLVAGFALFATRLLGAGDAKLAAASAPYMGLAGAAPFLLAVTLSGAVLAVLLVALRRVPLPASTHQLGWLVRLHAERRAMPYGIAIGVGGLLALPHAAILAV